MNMLQPIAISLFAAFWAGLYLANAALKSWWPQVYVDILTHLGVSVHILQIRWFTTGLNRLFLRLGQGDCFPWRLWFNIGVVFAMVTIPLATALLTLLVYNTVLSHKPIDQQVLQPVMPGVNLPMNQLGYYLGTLLLCGILHEVGHAIAAVREKVRVNGFGIFFLGVYPGAYVDLVTSDLQSVSPMKQLRIYCAGVWHNAVIVLASLLFLLALPTLLTPLYISGSGVGITWIRERSVVSGRRGLALGETITRLNTCPVRGIRDWLSCLDALRAAKVPGGGGYCMPLAAVRQLDISTGRKVTTQGFVECCNNQSSTHLCFSYTQGPGSGPGKLPVPAPWPTRYACLPARPVTERPACQRSVDCGPPGSPRTDLACLLPSVENKTRLVRVVHSPRRPPLLFLGDPLDLHYSLHVSDFVPRSTLVPLELPELLGIICQYLISLSGALALLNVVPCYALDGQWILLALLEAVAVKLGMSEETRNILFSVLLLLGTLLIIANVVLALWYLFVT